MTRLKKLLSIVLAMTLIFTFSISAVAAGKDDVFVTQEMSDRDSAAIAVLAAEGASIRNMATKTRVPTQKKLGVSLLLQDDSRWADIDFPCKHGTYAEYGCAMTSYAMIAKYYKKSQNTPVLFAERYNTLYGDPCYQMANLAGDIIGKTTIAQGYEDQETMENVIIAGISNNKPAVMRVDAWESHYFVAYGYYITSEGNVTIYIRDPEGDSGGTILSDYFPDNDIMSYAIF